MPPVFAPTTAERHQMIAVAAYFLAERRHFAPGNADTDWINAEQQIDQMLAVMRESGRTQHDLEQVGLRNALLLWTNCIPLA
ncbi:DUF2934 domain-containing protein [Rhodoferax sp. 4810]|uniref:DUF2934 domain-containing protein n=2 Tax=Thiospirillum jenense TaxID=1653858 RepID=A0A839H9W1_9GAMM|nr:DUF2934 domain-containing protein [Rhodoferax jenense]MBB1125731.1 DUF2934 domain-containing protein [Thiospirillum jenense]